MHPSHNDRPNRRPERRRGAVLPTLPFVLLVVLLLGGGADAAVPSIDVLVPDKGADFQIAEMRLTIQVDQAGPVEILVTPPGGAQTSLGTFQPGDPVSSPEIFNFTDTVVVESPSAGLASDDPRRRNYTLTINPTGDFDVNTCQSVMSGDETWGVAVGGGRMIDNACLISFDENTAIDPVCDGFLRVVPNGEEFAQISGLASAEQTCRFGVDAMLVLDRSGSMGIDASPGVTRMQSLRDAVQTFLDTLDSVRATETANFGLVPDDNVGVVLFSGNASDLPGIGAGLNPYSAALESNINTALGTTAPSGSTSIGDGLISGGTHLGVDVANRRRVLVLVSDGDQNTDMRVASNVAARSVYTHTNATACPAGAASPGCTALPNFGTYDVCSVTAGAVSALHEQVNQDIALAGGCYYLNTLDFAELPVFFTNVLQDFLETTSWQTVLEGQGSVLTGQPASISFPNTSTSLGLTVGVLPAPGRFICLEVEAPDGTTFDRECNTGPVFFSRSAAAHGPSDLGGEWTAHVSDPETGQRQPTGFHLVVLSDDVSVHAGVAVHSDTFAPGDPVRVEATLRDGAAALAGLDPGGLRVLLATPGLTLGELMVETDVDVPPAGPDDLDPANARIRAAVEADPDALAKQESEVRLRDDGGGGDQEAGDGVYSAETSFDAYGSSDLVVILEGRSERGGDFRRQIRQTVFIRALPDPASTEVVTDVIGGDLPRLDIRLTPRTRFGHPIGPGWGNHIWVSGPGVEPFKLSDDLNGTYSGSLPFSGDPPDPSVHFIPDSVVIGDEVGPEDLPSPLDESTVLLPTLSGKPGVVGPSGGGSAATGWSGSLHLGVNDPQSPLSNAFDGALSAGLDLEYAFAARWALELFVGYDEFDAKGGGGSEDVTHFAVDLRHYFTGGGVRPFVLAGLGAYDGSGSGIDVGLLAGGGVQFPWKPNLGFELEARYHTVDVNPDNVDWLAFHAGLRVGF